MILYEGNSMLDGAPIVVIAVGIDKARKAQRSGSNAKTGAMVQTYILRSDVDPRDAIREGSDSSICGECVHRGDLSEGRGRTCYVNIGQGPTIVYKTYRRGGYQTVSREAANQVLAGLPIRFGTYGDPAAAPLELWQWLQSIASGTTGYTHQWRTCPTGFADVAMASADSVAEAREAQALGYRTFRVRHTMQDTMPREVTCPASAEAGNKLQCQDCLACSGGNRKSHITILAHGGTATMANVKRRNLIAVSAA